MKQIIIAKRLGPGWEVYNKTRGSYPKMVPGFGTVKGPFKTEDECAAEAETLARFFQETS